MKNRSLFNTTALFAAASLFSAAAHADATLDKIKERGKINIGITLNGTHWGSLDPSTQKPVGLHVELAETIAKRLGTGAELIQVQASNRSQFLQQGKVDILVTNMVLSPERTEVLGYVPTPIYRVGATAVFLKGTPIKRWEDLRGRTVCLSQGSNYAKQLATDYGAVVKGFKGSPESLLALKGNNCEAAVHDSILVHPLLKTSEEWKNYTAPLPEFDPENVVIWTRKGEQDTINSVDKIVKELHRSGWFINAEKKYDIYPPLPALKQWQQQYKKAGA